jgi:prolyl oligopeptidase
VVSSDGRWIFVKVWMGWHGAEIHAAPLGKSVGGFAPIYVSTGAPADVIPSRNRFVILAHDGAPFGQLLASPAQAHPRWNVLVPERPGIRIKSAVALGDRFALVISTAVHDEIEICDARGRTRARPALPAFGSVDELRPISAGRVAFEFQSFAIPPRPMTAGASDAPAERWERDDDAPSPSRDVRLVTYRALDGTPVTMYVVRPSTAAAGRPFLMRVYGGFGIAYEPHFDELTKVLLDHGWGVAVPHLRGGGEYGETWHRAATRTTKALTFDDAAAAASYLLREGYAINNRIAVQGSSNGGLTAGALLTRRPDLLCAAALGVPILDMVRFPLFGEGKSWTGEFGSPENPEELRALLGYSPYHNVRARTPYPAVIIHSTENDDRVGPVHARKMTAALQDATSSNNPIILVTTDHAGHAGTGRRSDRERRLGDVAAFLSDVCLDQ